MYLSSLRRSVWCSNPVPQARLICSSSRTDVMKEYNTWLKSDRGLPFKKLRDTIVGGKEDPKGRHRTRLEEAANALPPVQTVTFNPKADPDEYAQPVPAPIVEVNPVMKLASPFERHTIQQFPRPTPIRVDPYTGTMTGSGKRKTAHANVAIFLNGTGQITINGKHWMDYFPRLVTFFFLKLGCLCIWWTMTMIVEEWLQWDCGCCLCTCDPINILTIFQTVFLFAR
eukprot:TRINITY_DN3520_c0_g1_i1.p1 TRINITY_DN3520_c0_g1~~TRINITY_DN3520_c0_g1_i1.p1  ORF type:complete len:227 (-),score=26.74 TRINITY_DN3520_c0_g1_i1:110-790(-)